MTIMSRPIDSTGQASERRYRHLFERLPVCIFVADITVTPAIIVEVNRQTELVYGYQSAELVGMTATSLVPDEAKPAALAIMQRVQQGETLTAETINQRRDGTRFPVRVIAAPDPVDDRRMIAMVQDISAEQQRRSEAEAIDAERHRIAHEIHDGVAQSLASLRFKSALWAHLADSAPPGMRAALEKLQQVLDLAIVDLRRAIFALRPVDLEGLGFLPALSQVIADFGDQNQMLVRLDVSGMQDTLQAPYELPLFRIIQEGLNNIGRHARASAALVRLDVVAGGGVTLSLLDNGMGFDLHHLGSTAQLDHFGLRQMRERILDLGGTLDIHSAVGAGTELIITLPPIMAEASRAQTDRARHATD